MTSTTGADAGATPSGARVATGFIGLMAVMSSVIALSLDAMLPALDAISDDLGAASQNARQDVVTYIFVGLAFSQLVFGPISDATGRKLAALAGFAIFLVGTAICVFAASFEAMLAGRVLQGVGAGGPRIISLAIIRDLYAGRAMARVVSLMSAVFILVPMLAPAIGQGIEAIAGWRAIFGFMFLFGLAGALWLWLGLPESLPPAKRCRFSALRLSASMWETLRHPVSLGYSVLTGVVFATFIAYLALSQQIFQEIYDLGAQFPLAFASMAGCFGAATLVNARLVERMGMRPLARIAITSLTIIAVASLAISIGLFAFAPPLWAFLAMIGPIFFCVGVLFGNFNALALEPMGHIAGAASSVVASLSTFIAMTLGGVIAGIFEATVTPLLVGFALCGALGVGVIWLTERARVRLEVR